MSDKVNSPDEVVDVIDENDVVIGKSTRAEVNSNPNLLHRQIAILIFDENGKVLTQQRSRNKKNDPLVWIISVAGHVPSGMGYEEAAHMELREELGFDTDLTPYEKRTFKTPNETLIATSFLGKFHKNAKVVFNKYEIETYRFVNLEELEELNKNEQVEKDSLDDFRKFFRGEYDKFKKLL